MCLIESPESLIHHHLITNSFPLIMLIVSIDFPLREKYKYAEHLTALYYLILIHLFKAYDQLLQCHKACLLAWNMETASDFN